MAHSITLAENDNAGPLVSNVVLLFQTHATSETIDSCNYLACDGLLSLSICAFRREVDW